MKTLSIAEFEALVARPDWVKTQDHDSVERDYGHADGYDSKTGESGRIEFATDRGWLVITSTLDGLSIIHHRLYSLDLHNPDSLTTTANNEVAWEIKGFRVVDEDGKEIDAHDLADYLPSDHRFEKFDSSKIITEQITDIDADEDSDMETITLEIDNSPSIRFTGERIASASSREPYNDRGRWTELSLYKTKTGKYICHQIGRTQWVNEHDRYSGQVCDTQDEVKQFFGQGWLAKELYEEAGINNVITVE